MACPRMFFSCFFLQLSAVVVLAGSEPPAIPKGGTPSEGDALSSPPEDVVLDFARALEQNSSAQNEVGVVNGASKLDKRPLLSDRVEKDCAGGGTACSNFGNSSGEAGPRRLGQSFIEASSAAADHKGRLWSPFHLVKKFNLNGQPDWEFDIQNIGDQYLTHSCANYINDGSTVFTRNGKLVLKVASACDGGGCLNSGRVMSKDSFRYGLFTFKAKIPKCRNLWPALWLLPVDVHGHGQYGQWPCSGEIDVLETVHDQHYGTFNVVAGYGSSGGCAPFANSRCNRCNITYCTSTTFNARRKYDRYFVEPTDCRKNPYKSWREHTFALHWTANSLTTWIDPRFTYNSHGHITSISPSPSPLYARGMPTWRTYRRETTFTWLAVEEYMGKCFPGRASRDAPFDNAFKIVMNIAIGGYGGAPCFWSASRCTTHCGGAVGAEMEVSDISVWHKL